MRLLIVCSSTISISVVELLRAGADPNWNQTVLGMKGNALHEAIQCDAPLETIRVLLDHDAKLDAKDAGERTPTAIAIACGREDIIETLVSRGASRDEAGVFEQFVGACFRADAAEVETIRTSHPNLQPDSYHDQLWLHDAIRRGAHATLELLLAVDFDLDTIDYEGHTPLHRAVLEADEFAVTELLERNASTSLLNFDGNTVVETALKSTARNAAHIIDRLASSLPEAQFNERGTELRHEDVEAFERAADAVATGDCVSTERDFVGEAVPEQSTFRAPSSLYVDELRWRKRFRIRTTTVARLMRFRSLKRFFNTVVTPTHCVTPIEVDLAKTRLGLLLSSGVVESAEQQTAMVRAMVKGGATIEEGYRLFFKLLDAKDDNTTSQFVDTLDMDASFVRDAFFTLGNAGEIELMAAMLQGGFDVNTSNDLNQTALHWAALNGKEAVVDWLLEHDADPNLRELQFDGTAAGWADAGEHIELAKRLAEIQRST